MSSSIAVVSEERPVALSAKRASTFEALTEAAVLELRETGYRDFSVRAVAKRCGVSPATAYTYFASKDHLITEVYWRRLRDCDAGIEPGSQTWQRAAAVMRGFALLVAEETELAAACTIALLAEDPDVSKLRRQISRELHSRLVAAIGDSGSGAIQTLELALSGALIQVGTGHVTYHELGHLIDATAQFVLDGESR